MRPVGIALAAALLALVVGDATAAEELYVTSTAYNSVPDQTDETPAIAAWGDHLKPGMKVIAVSRDLLELGLGRGTRVRIDGLSGEYVVLDKMSRRWQRRIDIYMGEDVAAARQYGKRFVRIYWEVDPPNTADVAAPSKGDGP